MNKMGDNICGFNNKYRYQIQLERSYIDKGTFVKMIKPFETENGKYKTVLVVSLSSFLCKCRY